MSLYDDYKADYAYESDQSEKYAEYEDACDVIQGRSDADLIELILDVGPILDMPTFPAHAIARRCKISRTELTPKQRKALIHCLAHHYVFG